MKPNRSLLLVCSQNLLIFVTLNAGRVLLSLYALDLGATTSDVGVVIAMLYIAPLLLSWPAGAMADRFGARWLFVLGSTAGAAAMAAPVFWPALPALWIGAAGIGVATAFANVLGQNLVGVLSSPETRARNFSNYTMLGALTMFTGPLLAGFAIDHAGFALTSLLVSGVSFAATVLMLLWGGMLPAGERRSARSGNMLSTLAEPGMSRILVIGSIAQIGFDSFISFMPVYAHGVGLSASAIGAALSAFAVAAFLSRLVMMRCIAAWGEGTVLAAGFLFGAAAFFVLPLFEAAVALLAISFVFGLFIGFSQPITMMLVFSASAAGRSGEALGLRLTVNNFMRVIGPALFGATARAFGLAPLFIASGVLLCVGGYLSKHLHKR